MRKTSLLSVVYVLLFLLLLYTPIAIMIGYSFNNSELDVGWSGFTFRWYGELFASADAKRAVINSIIVSGCSTVISVLIGAFAAVGFHKFDFKGKDALDSFFYIPTIVPAMLLGVSLSLIHI